jgi:hypothetical protein
MISSKRKRSKPRGYLILLRSALYVHAKDLLSLGCINRASLSASAAVQALVSVDHVLAVLLGNCIYGASVSASAASDAIVRNLVCHWKYTSVKIVCYILSHLSEKRNSFLKKSYKIL